MPAFRPLFFLTLFLLAACDAPPPPDFRLQPVDFGALPGWQDGQPEGGLLAFRKGCVRLVVSPQGEKKWGRVCAQAATVPEGDASAARLFFERAFTPHRVLGHGKAEGLFTGYYEAELRGARKRDAHYRFPVYSRPGDLVMVDVGRFREEHRGETLAGRVQDGRLLPYATRAEIAAGVLAGKGLELLWADDPVDVFFLHIQGSGRVRMQDGSVLRLGYAGKNGHRYRSIGRELIARGEISKEGVSMPALRAWLAAHPEKIPDLLAHNPSFVFFRILERDGPIGSLGVALTPGRSLAVDRAFLPLGAPLWLDSVEPLDPEKPLRRLVVAQDTGGAIKGPVRGDLFWGFGAEAERQAGSMNVSGKYYLLLPKVDAALEAKEGKAE